MIRDVDYEKVAEIIAPIVVRQVQEQDDGQLELDLRHDEAPAEVYYNVLMDVVETMEVLKEIIKSLPVEVVDAAGMQFHVVYSDNVIGGSIRLRGGVEIVEEGSE